MPQPSEHEIEVFNIVLELPAGERATYLDRECVCDAAMRQRVEELLKASEQICPCLEGTVAGPLRPAAPSLSPTEKLGDRIGRYKLVQQIGEGGCGVVYMAEQEEPVRRRVALKVIKLGMDTKSVIARFEAERQALALMDHPNIAKVLDAGATEAGRPYFVMELVKAVPITRYCDESNLSTAKRLRLFVEVCQAVQHAHQKGIIHRDIKPSNILVADHDGVPVPKIIDFGIAKATTDQRLTDKTIFTAMEQFIGTPAYMSPEQASLSGLDIDTRSDIYSLGVLLYELLTGKTPFEAKRLREAGLDELRRIIREEEPARPSTRLPQTFLAAPGSQPTAHYPPLATDLDWIVMRCLEKDRGRRYETASGLAMDIQRHLENEPIIARPPSAGYRLTMAWRRNKTVFSAAAVIAIVLVAASSISIWQAVRASRAEKLAEQRLAESEANATLATQRLADSEAISKFLTEVFRSPDPARDGRTITVAESLANAATNLETELTNQAERRAKLQATLGATYFALGLYPDSIHLQAKVRDYYLAASGPEHPDTLSAMHNLARSLYEVGHWDEAVKMEEQVLAIRTKVIGPEHPDTLSAMDNLAIFYRDAGRRDEALRLREQVLALRTKVLGPEHPDTLWAMNDLAISYGDGRSDEALELRKQVLALRRKVLGPEHPDTIMAMHNLALSYNVVNQPDTALKMLEEVVPISRKINGPEHPDTIWAMNDMALSYASFHRDKEAAKMLEEVVALRRKISGPQHPDTLNAVNDLAIVYGCSGRGRDAITILEQACEIEPGCRPALATWQIWLGQKTDYETTRSRMVEETMATVKASTADRVAKVYCMAPSADVVKLARILDLARRAVELGTTDPWLPWYQLSLGMAEYRNGHYADACRILPVADQPLCKHHEIDGTARLYAAMSLFHLDKQDEARRFFNQSEAQMPPLPKDETKPHVEGRPLSADELIWWLAYKEAKALLESPSAPMAASSVPK